MEEAGELLRRSLAPLMEHLGPYHPLVVAAQKALEIGAPFEWSD